MPCHSSKRLDWKLITETDLQDLQIKKNFIKESSKYQKYSKLNIFKCRNYKKGFKFKIRRATDENVKNKWFSVYFHMYFCAHSKINRCEKIKETIHDLIKNRATKAYDNKRIIENK